MCEVTAAASLVHEAQTGSPTQQVWDLLKEVGGAGGLGQSSQDLPGRGWMSSSRTAVAI